MALRPITLATSLTTTGATIACALLLQVSACRAHAFWSGGLMRMSGVCC